MRHLFNVLAGVSLVLCLGIMALWLNSYYAFGFGSDRGHLLVYAVDNNGDGREYLRLISRQEWDAARTYVDLRAALHLPSRDGGKKTRFSLTRRAGASEACRRRVRARRRKPKQSG